MSILLERYFLSLFYSDSILDEVIIQEGQLDSKLRQIASGSVRIEKKVNDRSTILNKLSAGETVGEVAFLEVKRFEFVLKCFRELRRVHL